MAELFADIPEALENSVMIAARCNVDVRLGEIFLPEFEIPDGMTQDEFFRKISHDGLTERLDFLYPRERYPRDGAEYWAIDSATGSGSISSSISSSRWASPATS